MLNQEVIDLFCAVASAQGLSNFNPVHKVFGDRLIFMLVLDLSLEDLDVDAAPGLTEVSLEDLIASISPLLSNC